MNKLTITIEKKVGGGTYTVSREVCLDNHIIDWDGMFYELEQLVSLSKKMTPKLP